jgi:hypothetical protein
MKKSILILGVSLLIACSAPQSKWSQEEVSNQLCGCCFKGTDSYGGEQTTVFSKDGTWKTLTNTSGQQTTNEDNGTWSIKEYDKKHDWWIIDLHNGKTTELSTTTTGGKIKPYLSGWGSVYHATKE